MADYEGMTAAERQADQLKPREITEGIATRVSRDDLLFSWYPGSEPDIRIGDLVRITLIAAAVEDLGFDEDDD